VRILRFLGAEGLESGGSENLKHDITQSSGSSVEPIKNPVLLHADGEVFATFLFVVTKKAPFTGRDELDDDGRRIAGARQPARANPDDAIGSAAVIAYRNVVFVKRRVEPCAVRIMVAVGPKPMSEPFIRIAFLLEGRWRHDKDPMDQFVAVPLLEFGDVEFIGCQDHAGGARTEPQDTGFRSGTRYR
jgi:hypothetical protein